MNFKDAVRTVLSKYMQFDGRAGRSEYWYWILALVLVSIVLTLIEGAVLAPAAGFEPFDPEAGQPLRMLLALVIFLPTLAVSIRRLHDGGRSGWWLFIQVVPIIGGLILLWWYVQAGDEADNEYGPPHHP
jgi:uncharacterized membrane protein YhaH (DUF805 family)